MQPSSAPLWLLRKPRYPNEYVNLLGKYIEDNIGEEAKRNIYFYLLIGETNDASRKEQTCMIFGCFKEIYIVFRKRVIGTVIAKINASLETRA